ncbi:MAG: hypothetical protein ACO3C1_09985 [Ilumatobacteraceae bacterium]
MTRLRKADVEVLLRTYDDDPVAALTAALQRVLEVPDADWVSLVELAGFADGRRRRLLDGDQRSLDELAAELNEQRSLPPGSR